MIDVKEKNLISPNIYSQIPEYIRLNNQTLVAFLEAYYEWLEKEEKEIYLVNSVQKNLDIDKSVDSFVEKFREQYLLGFPKQLAVSENGTPVNEKTLIKNIKSWYRSKGTEKSYNLLFRVIYDSFVDFYYPKVDILKASDGKWIQNRYLRTTNTIGKKAFESINKKIYQKDANGNITASARVSNALIYQLGSYQVSDFLLDFINGSFLENKEIFIETNNSDLLESSVYSIVKSVTIISGGFNYKVGDDVVFTNNQNDSGQKAEAIVSEIDSSGSIKKIKMINFGVNYKIAPTITISSQRGYGFSGTVNIGSVGTEDGYFANNDGKISSNKVMQDNKYYQNYSYVLKSEVSIKKYKDILKRLVHPAGMEFFGIISIKRKIKDDIVKAKTGVSLFEVPIIGHYAPYTFTTFDNLRDWFVYFDGTGNTFAGYNPDVHDNLLSVGGGNPITFDIQFNYSPTGCLGLSGFERADPFWVIYNHPNKSLSGQTKIAKIYDSQKEDFLNVTGFDGIRGWSEWVYNSGYTSERSDWENSFSGTDYKYALLRYKNTSEFKKITLESFLKMPLKEQFGRDYTSGNGSINF